MMKELGKKICDLCNKQYNELPKKGKPSTNQWTVLSAVVMELSQTFTVLTMATGTKCVGEKQKTPYVISDSHAEVLCLRLFRLFLLEDMTNCLQTGGGVCLERGPGQTFLLKEGVSFHFYSSCVMCGDATISEKSVMCGDATISEKTETSDVQSVNSFNQGISDKKRPPTELSSSDSKHPKLDGMTRTGAKSLLSDNLHADTLKTRSWNKTSVLRTKPGRGPVCLSLSCSDKLMKRQFLGLQGGLLSQFLPQPIRFTSLSIGGEFSVGSVKRALFQRLPDNSVSQPLVLKVEDIFVNSVENCRMRCTSPDIISSSSSLLWMRSKEKGLQWAAVKGKLQGATKSSLPTKVMLPVCRAAMLQRAVSLNSLFETSGNISALDATIPMEKDEFKKKHNLFRRDSWYRISKEKFCSNFVGWDRKMSREIYRPPGIIEGEDSK